MVGLRYEVGGDWFNYEDIYLNVSYKRFSEALIDSDPAFSVLNWVSHWLGFDIWFVNLTCAALFVWGLVRFARRQSNPWLSILIAVPYLIIVVGMGYTRQAVAIGFILAGLSVVDRASLLRFSFYIIAAATFHKSAIVVLPIVGLAATRQRIVIVPMLAATAALVYYLFVSASVDALMQNYVEAELSSQGAAIRVGMNLPPALVYLLLQRRFGLDDQQRKLWRNFSIASIGALVILMFTDATTAVDRLSLYLIPLQMFVLSRLPDVLGGNGRRNSQVAVGIIGYSALIQYVWLNFAAHSEYWLPYQVYPIGGAV
ncbi:EpsG family protein [Sphingomonas parva]|uniref:EpsG family protein n=2 Tax=Sphingomonas parva TaxID=2555898 RepID=A0A4Y8ZZ04_9SPHN|nr:EpsG family protein [Sphingomonas parva]